jgi:hypothetical protein
MTTARAVNVVLVRFRGRSIVQNTTLSLAGDVRPRSSCSPCRGGR